MKNALTSSVRKVLLGVFMAFAAVCYTSAETSMWTTSYFEKELSKSSFSNVSDPYPSAMSPMFLVGKFENGYIHMGIEVYSGCQLPCAMTFKFYYERAYYGYCAMGEATYVNVKEYGSQGHHTLFGPQGDFVKLIPTGLPMPYYSITGVIVRFKVNSPGYEDFFKNAVVWIDPSVREALETCSLLEPGAPLTFQYEREY